MKASDAIGSMVWAFPRGDGRQDDVRALAKRVAEMESALARAEELLREVEGEAYVKAGSTLMTRAQAFLRAAAGGER